MGSLFGLGFKDDLSEDDDWKDEPAYGPLFCLRCGSSLNLDHIDSNGVEYYYCSNKDCCHASGMLEFHYPFITKTGPGESYSLSWIK
jgi:hypothetical protein